jgi:PAS domain S-box-containing protein
MYLLSLRMAMTKVLTAPTFVDPEQTESARWLHTFLLLTFFVAVGALFFLVPASWMPVSWMPVFWMNETLRNSSFAVIVFLLASILGSWFLMRAGRYQIAALMTIGTLFLIPTYLNMVVYQTIRSPDVWVYFILIPLTGLLLGRRHMLYFTLLCLCVVLTLFAMEATELLIPAIAIPAEQSDFVILSVSISLNAILLYALIRRAEDKATEAKRAIEQLIATNEQLKESQRALQHSRDQLELRVDERTQALQTANQSLQEEIATRQQLMDALHHSEANWRSLVQNAPELIATVAIDGTILFVNRDVRNSSADVMCGRSIVTLHSAPLHQQSLRNALMQVLTVGEPASYESEEEEAGKRSWAINRLGPIYQDGVITALILISTDITEQKHAEMAMLHSQKLESLGVMAGGVAHDFNNLLTAIIGQTSLALNKAGTNIDGAQEHMQNVLLASHRATALTRQMLNYAGRSSADIKPLDLNHLIEENVQFFSASIPKSIRLQTHHAAHLPGMTGDAGQIQQLIMNLILNAADAIGQQAGTITITTAAYQLATQAVGQWNWSGGELAPGSYVLLEVVDTGCGMASETLNKIFDPFFTTKVAGRGLGLASVLGIVRTHCGGLQVTSTPDIGTIFRILFPASEYTEQEKDFPMTTYETTPFNDKLVLIIDDENEVRQVTAEILDLSGIATCQAANGLQGLELFRQHIDEIDLVILDLSMPGMSGEEVLKRLWQLKPGLAVTLLSGYDQHEVTRRMGSDHVLSFLQKPYSMDGLLQEISHQFAKAPKTSPFVKSDLVLAG